MTEFKKIIYSGICMCGHSWEDHHLSMVMNEEAYETVGPYFPEECEFYGFNETGGKDEDGDLHCNKYVDKDDLERKEKWKGSRR